MRPPASSHRLSKAPLLVATLLLMGRVAGAGAAEPPAELADRLLVELVGFRTTADRPDQIREAIHYLGAQLRAAGFPDSDVVEVSPGDDKLSLVARLRGSGAGRPLLLMAHVDVVPAEADGWSSPPFSARRDGGWWYGRGTSDNKAGVATLIANLIRFRREGFVPARDLVAVITADEETDGRHIDWLMKERRDLVDAELALNTDAGGGRYDAQGEPQVFTVQTAEKVYQSFQLSVVNPGGHSSVPRTDNAIYELAAALGRLAAHRFPIRTSETTRASFASLAELETGSMAADLRRVAAGDEQAAERVAEKSPVMGSLLRTTCVATQLAAGHAENALPRLAKATVNCRIFPGVAVEAVESELRRTVDDDAVKVERVGFPFRPSPPSPLRDEVMAPIAAVVQELWPGTPVVPSMSTGATDGLFVRSVGIPVYGVSAIFARPDDVRAHGLDERVGVEELHRAVEFWYQLLRRLAA